MMYSAENHIQRTSVKHNIGGAFLCVAYFDDILLSGRCSNDSLAFIHDELFIEL